MTGMTGERKKIKAVFLDLGDTLVDEGKTIRDPSGKVLTAGVIPGAFRVLRALRGRGLKVVLISNGISADARNILASTGLGGEFDGILISQEVGSEKPDRMIFEMALDIAGVEPAEAFMIGNRASADVAGAKALGIGSVWFRWNDHYGDRPASEGSKPDFTIDALPQLLDLIEGCS